MTAGTRGIIIGIGGLMAGGFAAAVIDWSPWPKAGVVAAVCVVVSAGLWLLVRPGRDHAEPDAAADGGGR